MFDWINRLPEKLKRITSGSAIIREIDGLRFIAIFTVIMQHLHERFIRYTSVQFPTRIEEHGVPFDGNVVAFIATRGFIGVYIFFIISGFILALPFAKNILSGSTDLKLKKYYIRRLTRLEPPYLIWMTILFLSFVFFRNQGFSETLPHYLGSITYTHGIIFKDWSPFNPPTWTLEVEVQFYIMAPFLAWAFFSLKNKITRRITIVGFILIIMGIQQYFKFLPMYLSIFPYLQYFLAGFILTDIYLCDWKDKIVKSSVYDYVALASLAIAIMVLDWEYDFEDRIAVLALLFLFFYSVFKGNYVNKFFTNRWIMAIGGMCYTIYLIHLPLAEAFMMFTKNIQVTNFYSINFFAQALLFLPLLFVICSIGYLLFEKPFMNKDWPRVALSRFRTEASKMTLWMAGKKGIN